MGGRAIELAPPPRQQVSGYLAAAGGALAAVRVVLDVDESLWAFVRPPLVLPVVALTYQDRPTDALRTRCGGRHA